MKTKTRSALRLLVVLLVGTLLVATPFTACKKKQKSGAQPGTKSMAAGEAPKFDYLSHVPGNSFGYMVWDTSSSAYKRLKGSPWGKGESPMKNLQETLTPQVKEILEIVKQAGVDPFAPDSLEKSAKKGAVYFAPAPSGSKNPVVFAVAFEADSSVNTAKLFEAFKKGLEQEIGSTSAESYAKGQGFSFEMKQGSSSAGISQISDSTEMNAPAKNRAYAGYEGQRMVLATAKTHVDDFLSGKTVGVPEVIKSKQYASSTRGFMPADQRIVEGYVDTNKLREAAQAGLGDSAGLPLKMQTFPLDSIAFVSGMSDTPRADVRIAYNSASPEIKDVKNIVQGSTSEKFLKALPQNLALYFSLDGPTLKGVKDKAMASGGALPPAAAQQLALLDNVNRLGFGARVAPLGQSMLPLPEMIVMVDSSNPAPAKDQLKGLLSMAMQQAMGGQPWMTKQIGDTQVDYVGNPMMSVYIAATSDMVLLSSAESIMQGALAGGGASFADRATSQVADLLANRNTVSNLYVNFDQVGTFIESMRGSLAMFAGQSPEIQKLLEPKKIAQIKQLGVMTGAIAPEENGIFATMFYQHAPKQMAKVN